MACPARFPALHCRQALQAGACGPGHPSAARARPPPAGVRTACPATRRRPGPRALALLVVVGAMDCVWPPTWNAILARVVLHGQRGAGTGAVTNRSQRQTAAVPCRRQALMHIRAHTCAHQLAQHGICDGCDTSLRDGGGLAAGGRLPARHVDAALRVCQLRGAALWRRAALRPGARCCDPVRCMRATNAAISLVRPPRLVIAAPNATRRHQPVPYLCRTPRPPPTG